MHYISRLPLSVAPCIQPHKTSWFYDLHTDTVSDPTLRLAYGLAMARLSFFESRGTSNKNKAAISENENSALSSLRLSLSRALR